MNWKNPYLWVALIGLITIPAMRPCFRRVPTAPPVLGNLCSFELTNAANKRVKLHDLEKKTLIIGLCPTSEKRACDKTIDGLARLHKRLLQFKVNAAVVVISDATPQTSVVDLLGSTAPSDLILLRGSSSQFSTLFDACFSLYRSVSKVEKKQSWSNWIKLPQLLLVDDKKQIRGSFFVDETGLDESFHRAMRVAFQP